MRKTLFIAIVAMCMAMTGCQKEEPAKNITNSKDVRDTTATGGGGCTITINPWPDTVVEGYFEL
ncbi:MAG: hypothetical protein J6V33_04520 [Bacteroidales bacterium]|nr:hypothetical protein [Bacteroidales bacterium]